MPGTNPKKVFSVTLGASTEATFDITGLGLVAMINLVQDQLRGDELHGGNERSDVYPGGSGGTYNQTLITSPSLNPVVSWNSGTTVSTNLATITTTQANTTTFTSTSNVVNTGSSRFLRSAGDISTLPACSRVRARTRVKRDACLKRHRDSRLESGVCERCG